MPDDVPPGRATAQGRPKAPAVLFSLLALLLYALLIDAAVETYQSASSVRMYVAVPVAAYVSFTLWLLRQHSSSRPGPVASIWLSLFLFLGILAVTASMPDGLDAGVRAVTLPTATVLSIATAAVIALALVALTVGSPLPTGGRIAAGFAACYGLAAFGSGIAWHRSYVQLLQGGSIWERLPYWGQGAFIGSLVVLPLAFAIEVLVALARVKVKGRMHRILAFALAIAIAYAAFTATASTPPTQPRSNPAEAPDHN